MNATLCRLAYSWSFTQRCKHTLSDFQVIHQWRTTSSQNSCLVIFPDSLRTLHLPKNWRPSIIIIFFFFTKNCFLRWTFMKFLKIWVSLKKTFGKTVFYRTHFYLHYIICIKASAIFHSQYKGAIQSELFINVCYFKI